MNPTWQKAENTHCQFCRKNGKASSICCKFWWKPSVFQIKMNEILKGERIVVGAFCALQWAWPGFHCKFLLRNISGDVFDTADEILRGYSAATDIAGNFKECLLLNTCVLRGALKRASLKCRGDGGECHSWGRSGNLCLWTELSLDFFFSVPL